MIVTRLALILVVLSGATHAFVTKPFAEHTKTTMSRLRQRAPPKKSLWTPAILSAESETSSTLENTAESSSKVPQTQKELFANDGPFSWMTPFLFAYQDGKSLAAGIPVEKSSQSSSAENTTKDRQGNAEKLMNIGMEERERRRNAGDVFLVITSVYVLWASLIADHGDFAGHILRFMTVLPLFFTVGFKKSADSGL